MRPLRQEEVQRLRVILENNWILMEILRRAPSLLLPDWYLGAGCVAQTIWNVLHGFEPLRGINDYDLVYFDATDVSYEGEGGRIRTAESTFRDLQVVVDVKNEARVHIWYEKHFGYPIPPYRSVEDAIRSWPTTATSIGVRFDERGNFLVCAPFGLEDLFSMVVRPNKRQVTREVYIEKAKRWARWSPKLAIIPSETATPDSPSGTMGQ